MGHKVHISNPFQINDWEIKKFLAVVIAIQLAMLGVAALDLESLGFLPLRQVIGFIYLTFIPGIVILRLMKIHRLKPIQVILYSVGLSLAFLMLVGLLMNLTYPNFGLSRPLAKLPLIITISIIIIALTIWSYYRDRRFSEPNYLNIEEILSPPALFLFLLPLLSFLGTYLVNFHQSNVLLLVLIALIALIAVFVSFGIFIPKRLYPLAVFVISISLLYHTSLISSYLLGMDIKVSYYFYRLVEMNSFWDSTISGLTNSVLAVTILPAVYSSLSSIEGTWLFKVVYPFIFSLVPLGLYHIYQKQTDEKTAFLASFLFMSFNVFYGQMLALGKQMIAMLFFVLLPMLILDRERESYQRRALFIVFSMGVIVSHYATGYLFMIFLVVAFLATSYLLRYGNQFLTWSLTSLFIVLVLAWYMNIAKSATFETIVNLGNSIYNSLYTEFLNPEAHRTVQSILTETQSLWRHLAKVVYYMVQFFIAVGIMKLIIKWRQMKFYEEYVAFSLTSCAIIAASLLIPHSLGPTSSRVYLFALVFLAPFCIIGINTVFGGLARIFRHEPLSSNNASRAFASIILVLYLLLNTGFIYEIANDRPQSISLSQENILNSGDSARIGALYTTTVPEQEVYSARWLSQYQDSEVKIYADLPRRALVLPAYAMSKEPSPYRYTLSEKYRAGEEYVYLGYLNVRYGLVTKPLSKVDYWDISEISAPLNSKNKIYSNGGSEIFK